MERGARCRMRRGALGVAAWIVFVMAGASLASPSAFPETGVTFRAGYDRAAAFGIGGELRLDVPYVDASTGLDLALALDGTVEARLSGTGLVFPTLGTTPPLALGVGADLTWRDDAFRVHVGLVTGLDLLFVSEIPGVVGLYLAPGYGFGRGFSFAWSLDTRYYFDAFAVVLGSSDLVPFSLGVRVTF